MTRSVSVTPARKSKRPRHEGREDKERTIAIELMHARWRHLAWCVVAALCTLLFVFAIGGAGIVLLGVPCLIATILSARSFFRTLVYPPGRIVVSEDTVDLAARLCSGREVSVPVGDLKSAYLLRRAAPWSASGPVLVVETRAHVFQYPRDWFASDDDQWRVFRTLNRRIREA